MESQVIDRAIRVIEEDSAEILSFQFQDPAQGDVGVCGGEMEVFVEPVKPSPTVIVIGAGHVGREVAALADWLGFQVVLSDDRPEFADPQDIIEGIEVHHGPMNELSSCRTIHQETYLVLTTRDVTVDVEGLPTLLDTTAGYIGIIGSKRRWETTKELLIGKGVSENAISRVHSPMGLEIHAETPREIALSVMAEIVALRNKG
jgi:xanthine dehydrogenase accessory factor